MTDADVIVVGGGVVGCAAAYELAPDVDVLVLERDQIAGGATGKASGLVSPMYDHQANLEAATYATEFFRSFDGTRHFTFSERDGVFLFTDDERSHAVSTATQAADAGFDTSITDTDGIDRRYPGVFHTDQFDGAVVFGDAGWVDSYTLATTLQKEAESRGARFQTGITVETVETGKSDEGEDRVTGVTTDEGRFEADTVVVAAGWRTRPLLDGILEVPVRPFRYQTANLEVARDLEPSYPIAWEHDTLLYWRPTRDGSLHVGGQPYFVAEPGSVRQGATADFKRLVATSIPSYLADLGDPRLQSDDTCLTGDAATPDGLPIVDAPAEAPDGLVVATGWHGFGIMLAPVAGEAIRALVTDEDAPFSLAQYRLDRFGARTMDFGSDYILPPQ